MSNKQPEIKNIINSLSDFEKELENIKNQAIVKKSELIKMTKANSEKIKNKIIQETSAIKNDNIKKIVKENKSKANDIVKTGDNEGKKLQIKIDSKIRIPNNKIRNKINNNPLFKVTNTLEDASVTISIQKDDNAINIALSRKNRAGELEKIDEKFIRGRDERSPTSFLGLDLTNIVNTIGQLLDSIFETNLEFEITKYEDCDENVTIVIENEKYVIPKEFKNFPGQTREGSIPIKKGRVNYKIYYNRDKSSAIYDTTFYVNSVQDLNDFGNICFEKKRIPYSLTFSESIIPERKSKLIWDGENHKINSIGTKLYGFRHSKHDIVYIKNGFKPFKKTINPTNEIEYPIYVDPEKVRLNVVNNFKHIILPGRSQIELYRASFPRQMQGYIYQASYLYFIGKTIYHHNQYFNHQEKYDIALINFNSSLDQTPEYYQTLYDEVNYQHNLMSQELSDFETYGQYLILLFAANLIEVTINNVIF